MEYATCKLPIADATGEAIVLGSVLRKVDDEEDKACGVVVRIVREGDRGTVIDRVGDVHIKLGRGCTRVTSKYDTWCHVPHEEQTYEQRLLSWRYRPYDHENNMAAFSTTLSKEEGMAIDGIMSILPLDIVDWDYGPFPDRLEDALGFLVKHLEAISSKKPLK